MFKRILNVLNTFEVYVGALCMGIMITLLFAQVISRYVFNRAISWSEEVALIFFVLSIYFGSAAAVKRSQHLRLELILSKCGEKGKNLLLVTGNLVFFFFNCVILTGLYAITTRLHTFNTRSSITNFPRWIIYATVMFLFVLTNIRLIQDIYAKIKTIKNIPVENQPAEETTE